MEAFWQPRIHVSGDLTIIFITQKLAPTWEKLAESLHFTTNVRVSQIDCTEHKDVCQRFEVKGYPTLLWIVDGQKVMYLGCTTMNHEEILNNCINFSYKLVFAG